MEMLEAVASAVVGIILRFGLPVGLTLLVCWFFRRLDTRWQKEAETYLERSGIQSLVPVVRCWLLNDCPEERRNSCPAFINQGIPCWQQFRASNGELKEACLGCKVFTTASVPITA